MTPQAGLVALILGAGLALTLAMVGTQAVSAQAIEPSMVTVVAEDVTTAIEVSGGDASTAAAGPSEGYSRQDALIASVSIFVLAIFVGFEVITKVPPTLHTPLMSGSNAISGITLVGALLVAGSGKSNLASWLGVVAVVFATINVIGGFWVTHRMLSMFKRK